MKNRLKRIKMFDLLIYLDVDSYNTTYDCKRQGCWHNSSYKLNKDYGFYTKNDSNCILCQLKCGNEPECGAMECDGDKDHCTWWKFDKCTDKKSPGFFNYTLEQYHYGYTCYKGTNINIYEIQRNFNYITFNLI